MNIHSETTFPRTPLQWQKALRVECSDFHRLVREAAIGDTLIRGPIASRAFYQDFDIAWHYRPHEFEAVKVTEDNVHSINVRIENNTCTFIYAVPAEPAVLEAKLRTACSHSRALGQALVYGSFGDGEHCCCLISSLDDFPGPENNRLKHYADLLDLTPELIGLLASGFDLKPTNAISNGIGASLFRLGWSLHHALQPRPFM